MRSARFVTLCFCYSGTVLLAQHAVVYRVRIDVAALADLGVAPSVLAAGAVRSYDSETEAENLAEWGSFTYGLAALSLVVTVIFLAQLALVRVAGSERSDTH
jgi:hypothetical protein